MVHIFLGLVEVDWNSCKRSHWQEGECFRHILKETGKIHRNFEQTQNQINPHLLIEALKRICKEGMCAVHSAHVS